MGLRETIQSVAQTAIKTCGNVAVDVTFQANSTHEYNTTTGEVESTGEDLTIKCVRYSKKEMKEGAVEVSEKLFIAKQDLADDIIINQDDKITISNEIWIIKDIENDPADAGIVFTIERS